MNLTTSEQSAILNGLLKAKGKTLSQMTELMKSKDIKSSCYCDGFAREFREKCNRYAETKRLVRNDKNFITLRKELEKSVTRLNPMVQFLMESKSKPIQGYLEPLFEKGKKLTTKEALVLYTATERHSGKALDKFEIDMTFAMQESDLIRLARNYCKEIGLMVA